MLARSETELRCYDPTSPNIYFIASPPLPGAIIYNIRIHIRQGLPSFYYSEKAIGLAKLCKYLMDVETLETITVTRCKTLKFVTSPRYGGKYQVVWHGIAGFGARSQFNESNFKDIYVNANGLTVIMVHILPRSDYSPNKISLDPKSSIYEDANEWVRLSLNGIAMGYQKKGVNDVVDLLATYATPGFDDDHSSKKSPPTADLLLNWSLSEFKLRFLYKDTRIVAVAKIHSVIKVEYTILEKPSGGADLLMVFSMRRMPKFYEVTLGSDMKDDASIMPPRDEVDRTIYTMRIPYYENTGSRTICSQYGNGMGIIQWKPNKIYSRLYQKDSPNSKYPFLEYAPTIMVKKYYSASEISAVSDIVTLLESKFTMECLKNGELSPHAGRVSTVPHAPLNFGSLSFRIAYQLEVLFSNNIFPRAAWNAICVAFLEYAVSNYGEDVVLKCLEDEFDNDKRYTTVYEQLERIVDLIEAEKAHITQMAKKRYNIPPTCMYIRRAYVTPSHVYLFPPCVEVTNRVLRKYSKYHEHFIRVSFSDEEFDRIFDLRANLPAREKAGFIPDKDCPDSHYGIYKAISSGISIAGRHYNMLGFSSGQLRDHSCWFFSKPPDENIGVEFIRSEMGALPSMSVALYTARMGQCFSTTLRAKKLMLSQIKTSPDIERCGFVFSDGAGIISYPLALEVAKGLNMLCPSGPPSCFQFRLGGYKGVLSTEKVYKKNEDGDYVAIEDQDKYLILRNSQLKFMSDVTDLEIVAHSQRSPCFLNKQIITLLLAGGVRVSNIMEIAKSNVISTRKVMHSKENLLNFIRDLVEPTSHIHQILIKMASSSMYEKREKSLFELMKVITQFRIRDMRDRMRIIIEDGAQALGIIDNYGILEEDEVFFQRSNDPFGSEVITGYVILTRSPCFFVGDIRSMRCVNPDRPELKQFKDVVVFSSKGKRPAPDMMSGGDLDGDTFFISWNKFFVSHFSQSCPAHFRSPGGSSTNSDNNSKKITNKELAYFFCAYMCNDNLGMIANAHLSAVDILVNMSIGNLGNGYYDSNLTMEYAYKRWLSDHRIEELAQKHSVAVDFPKKAIPAEFKRHKTFKDLYLASFMNHYPHFMKKVDKITYHSKSILGKLYDYFSSCEVNIGYKASGTGTAQEPGYYLLNVPIKIDSSYMSDAVKIASAYRSDLLLLAKKYALNTEAEIFSVICADVKSDFLNREAKRVGFRSDIRTQLSTEVSKIINVFRDAFWEKVFSANYGDEGYSKTSSEYKDVMLYYSSGQKSYKYMDEIGLSWYRAVYDPLYASEVVKSFDFKQPSTPTLPLVIYDVILDIYERYVKKEDGPVVAKA